MTLDARRWLAGATLTETSAAAEMPWVMTVMLERTRAGGFPNSVRDVVLQRGQFSAFNGIDRNLSDNDILSKALSDVGLPPLGIVGDGAPNVLERSALDCAAAMLALPASCSPLPKTTMYWSPRSMVPAGSLPRWDFSILFCFEAPFVDPWRFVFARPREKWAGNQTKYDFRHRA